MSVRIVADSGCDIPPDVAAEHEIELVPCEVRFGKEMMSDLSLTQASFWQLAGASREPPSTAAAPPGAFAEAYARQIERGHDVVCLTLPARLSAMFSSASVATQEFGGRVRAIDSGSITAGFGMVVMAAANAARQGATLEEVERHVIDYRSRMHVFFMLDTLEWVRRGGRMERMMPVIERMARALHIKPMVELYEGELHLLGVSRSVKAAITRFVEESLSHRPLEAVATAYTRSRDRGEELQARTAAALGLSPEDVPLQAAGPMFATHAGPDAIGIAVVRATR